MKRTITALLVILTCLSCSHNGDILLRLNYKLGETMDVRYRVYVINKDGPEDQTPATNEAERMGFTVDSVINDSLYVIKANYYYVRINNSGGFILQNSLEYYSDEDEEDMTLAQKRMHAQLKPVLDSTYKLLVNNRGEVIKPYHLASGRRIPELIRPIDYATYQIVFPKEKVSIGDEWTNEQPIAFTGGKRISTYYIENIARSVIQIKVKGKVQTSGGVSKEFSGRYMLNQETKKLISAKIEMEASDFFQGKLKAIVAITVN